MTPQLRHFTDEQANDIRREIEWYLYPRVRRVTILVVFVLIALIGGATAGLFVIQNQTNADIKRNCLALNDGRRNINRQRDALRDFLREDLAVTKAVAPFRKTEPLIVARAQARLDAATRTLLTKETNVPLAHCPP